LRWPGGDGWHVNCKLPPGLAPGWHQTTLRTVDSAWGNRVRVAVDLSVEDRQLPPGRSEASDIHIATVTDGRTWERNLVHDGIHSCISLWVSGLPEDATKMGIAVWLGDREVPAVFLSEADPQGLRQINVMRPSGVPPGDYAVAVEFHNAVSEAVPVRLL